MIFRNLLIKKLISTLATIKTICRLLGDIKINQRPRCKCFSDLFLQWLFFDSLSDTDTNFKFQFSFDAQMHDRKYGQRQRKRRHMNVNYLIKVINSVIKTRPIKDGLITLLLTLEEYFYYWLWKFFGVFSVNYEQVLNCNVKNFFLPRSEVRKRHETLLPIRSLNGP